MRGMVEHLIIRPDTVNGGCPTSWDMTIIDKEGDELYEITDHAGRLDDREGFPLGKDAQEKLTLKFTNVSRNEPIKVIFRIRELT